MKLLAIAGPTASGKTGLAIALAKRYGGEIVSADSMQIYKEINIASAKPSEHEMDGVPHHLISCVSVGEEFSVADFAHRAKTAVSDILQRGLLPIVCGGTGLYLDALCKNMTFAEQPANREVRQKLYQRLEQEGADSLYAELLRLDPEMAGKVHKNNTVRLVRSLEICLLTGITATEYQRKALENPPPFEPIYIGLCFEDRQVLYDRIDRRVDEMLRNGLEEEAKSVLSGKMSKTAAGIIGIKEWADFFEGKKSREEVADTIKLQTKHYAKRQMTWFRRNEKINWIYVDKCENFSEISAQADEILKGEMQP